MSNQKPNVENINSQLRLFIDKKADLSNITQDQCYELASNMNCRLLNSLAASSPMDAFIQLYGEETLPKIHQHKIEPKSVAPKHIIKLIKTSIIRRGIKILSCIKFKKLHLVYSFCVLSNTI